ncbi:MAG: VanZ family protein [Gallionellaceae bacterium]
MNKLRWFWLILGLVWVASVFYISLTSSPPQPLSFWQADKFEHALAYGLLMLWYCQIYRQRHSRVLLSLLLIGMGVAIEYLQRETAYRTFDYADMLANATGVMLGWTWARTGLGRIFSCLEYHASRKFARV